MTSRELMRRRPGQGGCCGCGLAAVLGLLGLSVAGMLTVLRRGRHERRA